MSLRTTLQKLIRRDPAASLRERADEMRSTLSRRTIAAAVPLPALAAAVAPAAASSSLARACDAAVAHLAWINDPADPDQQWPDERLETELDKADAVVWRAAKEPAASLDDLSAKARLLIADSGQHLSESKFAGDRATLTLLREVAALTPARAMPPAPMAVAPVERAEYRARLLTAYAEDRARRPISNVARFGSVEERAADLVGKRLWRTAREVLALPPPATADGLALTALAATILTEADFTNDDPTITAAVGLTRAVLAFTDTQPPPGFVGFGDEPDHEQRDEALFTSAGSLPEWAVAQAQVECDAEDAQEDASDPAKGGVTLEEAAQLDFAAYTFDFPTKAPKEWAATFAEYAMAMHAADRTLRMAKPELIAFIRDAGGQDASLPGVMLEMLDAAQKTFTGWSKLLSLANTRYLVAASAATLSGDEPTAEHP